MQNQEAVMDLPKKSLLFGLGGLVIFILEVALLFFGISDGSLVFIAPLLASPFLSVLGIIYGIKAIKGNINPRALAIAGIVLSSFSLLIIILVIAVALMWVSGLAGVY